VKQIKGLNGALKRKTCIKGFLVPGLKTCASPRGVNKIKQESGCNMGGNRPAISEMSQDGIQETCDKDVIVGL